MRSLGRHERLKYAPGGRASGEARGEAGREAWGATWEGRREFGGQGARGRQRGGVVGKG